MENIWNLDKLSIKEEIVSVLYNDEKIKIEKIISCGQTTDWYDQEENELVILLQGIAELEFKNKEKTILKKDSFYYLKANKIHRVSYTSEKPPCIWYCIFFKSQKNNELLIKEGNIDNNRNIVDSNNINITYCNNETVQKYHTENKTIITILDGNAKIIFNNNYKELNRGESILVDKNTNYKISAIDETKDLKYLKINF